VTFAEYVDVYSPLLQKPPTQVVPTVLSAQEEMLETWRTLRRFRITMRSSYLSGKTQAAACEGLIFYVLYSAL
jgi:hypothetical protein